LISSLYDAKSSQCTTCGRRFFSNDDGKKKKGRHLDWHFKTNKRRDEAIKRGQNRSWFVDERVSDPPVISPNPARYAWLIIG
jgi:pre-mRNA cleavage complex 2 protein Pcf11